MALVTEFPTRIVLSFVNTCYWRCDQEIISRIIRQIRDIICHDHNITCRQCPDCRDAAAANKIFNKMRVIPQPDGSVRIEMIIFSANFKAEKILELAEEIVKKIPEISSFQKEVWPTNDD